MSKGKTSKKSSGSISAGGDVVFGGKTTAGGDVVKGNKITISQGAGLDDIARLFDKVYRQIDQLPVSVDKAEVREHADAIRDAAVEVAKTGKPPDDKAEKIVRSSAQNLAKMAPDILEVIGASLVSPAAGIAAVIRKVLDKAKAEFSS
jgi:hypothetical protein